MKKTVPYILVLLLFVFTIPARIASAQSYSPTFELLMELGKEALESKDYTNAYQYFKKASVISPASEEPLSYINLIQRIKGGEVEVIKVRPTFRPIEVPIPPMDSQGKKSQTSSKMETIEKALDAFENEPTLDKASAVLKDNQQSSRPGKNKERPKGSLGKRIVSSSVSNEEKVPEIIYLNDELRASQPRTTIRVELKSTLVIEGKDIDRFLIVTPGFIDVQRIDRDRIKVTGRMRGASYLHIWDSATRWTINVEVILPVVLGSMQIKEKDVVEYSNPFRLTSSTDWGSFYTGQSLSKKDLKRTNLTLLNTIKIKGETPYGLVDTFVVFNKFDQSTEATGYGIGLFDGQVGNFKDFSIRAFDVSKHFSPLTLPGQYYRGILFESKAFNKNLQYSYVHGRDRATFGFLSPSVINDKESFIEGVKVTLFPEKENQYSFNYARAYGDLRPVFLRDEVYSLQAQRRVKKILLKSEVAYDNQDVATLLSSKYDTKDFDLNVNFRDINKDFTTIVSFPSDRGEIGGNVEADWKMGDVELYSNIDLYRDRFLFNPDNYNGVNLDYNGYVDVTLSPTDRWRGSVFVIKTPQELAPRRNVRLFSSFSKKFPFWGERELSTFFTQSFQHSRFDFSPISDYDRRSLSAGLSFPMIHNLDYFFNYEYSWVDDLFTGDHLNPSVINTGVNYYKQITDHWTGNVNFLYRNEENTDGINSFLAGEDSITGGIGATYRPNADLELFLDGRVRNIWREGADSVAFNEMDVRGGLRTAWDLPLSWSPAGEVAGVVFKDLNSNGRQDEGEDGIPSVHVYVGHEETMTDLKGKFKSKVRAKRVEVSIDNDSLPKGFVFVTPAAVDVKIIPHKTQRVKFGLTTQSGIYGVVYYDKNANGKPDAEDEFIPKLKILLDGKKVTYSDFEGAYFFKNLKPAQYTIEIDPNTLPLEYLPLVKIKQEVDVYEGTTYVYHIPLKKNSK